MVFVIVHDRRDTSLAAPLNALRDKLLSRGVNGKLFQTDGPWNAKLRCLVDVFTQLGNCIHRVHADRSRRRPWTSSTVTQSYRFVSDTCRHHFVGQHFFHTPSSRLQCKMRSEMEASALTTCTEYRNFCTVYTHYALNFSLQSYH